MAKVAFAAITSVARQDSGDPEPPEIYVPNVTVTYSTATDDGSTSVNTSVTVVLTTADTAVSFRKAIVLAIQANDSTITDVVMLPSGEA